MQLQVPASPDGGTGRRKGLNIPRRQLRAVSIPTPGTTLRRLRAHASLQSICVPASGCSRFRHLGLFLSSASPDYPPASYTSRTLSLSVDSDHCPLDCIL